MNEAEVKFSRKRINKKPYVSSNPFKPERETDYDKKKKAERKAVLAEIKRVALNQSLV